MRLLDKLLTGTSLSLLLCGMALSSWSQRGSTGLRERMAAFVAMVDARELAVQHRRDAVWGATTDGCAFAHYEVARRVHAGHAQNYTWNDRQAAPFGGDKALDAEAAAAQRQLWSPVFAAVAAGAHARDRAPQGRSDFQMPLFWGLRAEVCARVHEQQTMSAVQLWLDVMTMLHDLDAAGVHLGLVMAPGLIAVWTDDRLAVLGAVERALLDAGIHELDRRSQVVASPHESLAAYVRPLLDGSRARSGWSTRERLWAWQHGMDPALWHLEGLAELVDAAELLLPAATTFAARERQWTAFAAGSRPSGTWISRRADEWLREDERCRRQIVTELRMLRLASAIHADVDLPELDDAFADVPLQVSRDATQAALRSAGGKQRLVRRMP